MRVAGHALKDGLGVIQHLKLRIAETIWHRLG